MEEKHCKWYHDEFCTNGDSPCVADYCPLVEYPELCKHRETDTDTNVGMTDEEIIKALENCVNGDYKTKCKGCYCNKLGTACSQMDKDILDLIHRLQNENKRIREQAEKDTAKKIFGKIFEVICCFSTKGKSEEYNKGYIDCLAEVDKRLQNLAQECGEEVD